MKKIRIEHYPGDGSPVRTKTLGMFGILWRLFFVAFAILGFLFFNPITIWEKATDPGLQQLKNRNEQLGAEIESLNQKLKQVKHLSDSTEKMKQELLNKSGLDSVELREMKNHTENNEYERTEPKTDLNKKMTSLKALKNRLRYFENLLDSAGRELPLIVPLKKQTELGALFGARKDPFTERVLPHNGVDWLTEVGDTIIAPADGVIVAENSSAGFGKTITMNHNSKIQTFYAHLSKWLVPTGRKVLRGRPIALAGASGRVTGPHLHYEIRVNQKAIDPLGVILP